MIIQIYHGKLLTKTMRGNRLDVSSCLGQVASFSFRRCVSELFSTLIASKRFEDISQYTNPFLSVKSVVAYLILQFEVQNSEISLNKVLQFKKGGCKKSESTRTLHE